MKSIARSLICASAMALTLCAHQASAQDVQGTQLDICATTADGGESYNMDFLASQVAGNWRMVASGASIATGTNIMSVNISLDASSQQLVMSGDGASTALNPLVAGTTDTGLDQVDIPGLEVTDFGDGGNGAARTLSISDMALLVGCNVEQIPKFWWRMGSGSRQSYGIVVFVSGQRGVGYMANSAGGSRTMYMTR